MCHLKKTSLVFVAATLMLATDSSANIYQLSRCGNFHAYLLGNSQDPPPFDPRILSPAPKTLDFKFLDPILGNYLRKQSVTADSWVTVSYTAPPGVSSLSRSSVERLEAFPARDRFGKPTFTWDSPGKVLTVSKSGGVIVSPPQYATEFFVTLPLKNLDVVYRDNKPDRPVPAEVMIKPGGLEHAFIVRGRQRSPAQRLAGVDIDPNTPWVSLPDWYVEEATNYYAKTYGYNLRPDHKTGMLVGR